MITRKNVQNSSLEFEPLVVDVDTVYKNFNESKIFDEETKEHIGWKYDQIQYDKNEFIELISEENEILKLELANTNMQNALLFNEQSKHVDLKMASVTMETAMLLSQLKGGEI